MNTPSTSVTDRSYYSYKVFTWALLAPWLHRSSASSCRQGYAGHRPDHWRPGLSPCAGYHTTSCQTNKQHTQTSAPTAAYHYNKYNKFSKVPYTLSLCNNLVSLLKRPISATLGHLCLLHSLLQLLGHGLTLLPQYLNFFIGTLHVQRGRVLFL